MRNEAVDIIEPNEKVLKEKLVKWQMVKKWNEKSDTNQWLKYDHIDPKCQILTSNWMPYNVIKEFDRNNELIKTIEVTIWSQKDVDENIEDLEFGRKDIDAKIYQGRK